MSHVSQVKTQIKDLKFLKEAIKSYGFSYYEGEALISQYNAVNGTKVDLAMDMNGNRNLGFNKTEDGTYEFCGDFYGMKEPKDAFVKKFVQRYTMLKIKDSLKKKGKNFSETMENGTIRLVVNL
jgi:hypothetical protein